MKVDYPMKCLAYEGKQAIFSLSVKHLMQLYKGVIPFKKQLKIFLRSLFLYFFLEIYCSTVQNKTFKLGKLSYLNLKLT